MTASSDLVTQRAPDLNDHPHTDRGDGEREWFWGGVASVATVSALMSFATALGVVDGRGPGDMWHRLLIVFLGLAVVAGLVAVAAALILVRSERVRLRQLPRLLIAFWCERVSGRKMFLLGSLLTLPAFALYTPRLVGDSDSARIVASILHVQRGGRDYLVETQEVLLQHIALGPVLALGGIPALQALNAFFVVLLGGVVAVIAWWLTRSPLGALAAALALGSLPAILARAYLVPMYSVMLAFGFLGVYLANRAILAEAPGSRWRYAGLAGLCLVLSLEAHQVGQLFLVLTALLVVTARPVSTVRGLGCVYAVVALLSVPRLAINVADGGLSNLLANRVDFWLTKGYLEPIQVAIFGYPVNDSHGEYLAKMSRHVEWIWGSSGLFVIALAVVGLVLASARLRRFGLACAVLLFAVAVYRQLPFAPRYFSPILVGTALAAGVALPAIRKRWRAGRVIVALALVGLIVSLSLSYRFAVRELQTAERELTNGPYLSLANEIPPGDGVIGTRSMYLDFATTDIRTFGDQFLPEEEYVTFLTWPSDAAVIDLMERHDAQWIFVPREAGKWVGRYNDVWLLPNYGKSATYHREVRRSPAFCLERRSHTAALYRLDPAGAGAVETEAPRRCASRAGS